MGGNEVSLGKKYVHTLDYIYQTGNMPTRYINQNGDIMQMSYVQFNAEVRPHDIFKC